MKKPFWRSIKMYWFYPLVAAVLFIGVLLFVLFYSGGGAEVLNEGETALFNMET